MLKKVKTAFVTSMVAGTFGVMGVANASGIEVTVENLAASNGFFLTPTWVGFHDGSFDVYDTDAKASAGLERLAEDGNTSVLSSEFAAVTTRGAGGVDDVIFDGGPIAPGTSASKMFDGLDKLDNRYFSYAAMVIPTNDAFIANGSPSAYALFNDAGEFTGPIVINIYGKDVLDAGTEVNDEFGVAFLTGTGGQTSADQGSVESNLVGAHAGLLDGGNILGGTTAAGTVFGDDIIGSDTLLARITINQLPEPSSLGLLGLAGLAIVGRRRKTQG
ncbi:Spondin_N [Poriferisphaera corsica]|uniref:Spondin_N n=1 Tax=Poriferisphaera corsica TaxID=2528020 RepID=A0A517YQ98_9BACT|nr:spondin domain-containing protein [Poriferisphaera corsica]QDU32404.1 Spondin_N [Poriferisphaera corsica]